MYKGPLIHSLLCSEFVELTLITFEPPILHIPQGEIQMTLAEVAELFNTAATHIRHTIRTIYRSDVLLPCHTTQFVVLENGNYEKSPLRTS